MQSLQAPGLALLGSLLCLNACSKPDDLVIEARGERCSAANYTKTSMKVSDHQGRYYITIYGTDEQMNVQQSCHIVVDKKSGKVVQVLLGQ